VDAVLRGAAIYLFLLFIFRITGKKSLSHMTTFDFVLLLIIGEVVAEAMIGNDSSFTNAVLLVFTIVGLDIGISIWKQHSIRISKLVDSVPLVLIEDGHIHRDRMEKAQVGEDDILAKARELQGLERLDQIKYAILERSGGITVVPKGKS
jgi:uncharacterized membrane protein YcaP (DUF421 family)